MKLLSVQKNFPNFLFCSFIALHSVYCKAENVIYHAFDENYSDIKKKLKHLSETGVTHVQISPPQEARNTLPYSAIDRNLHRKCRKHSKNEPERRCSIQDLEFLKERETVDWNRLFNPDGTPVFEKKPWYLHYQPVSYQIGDSYGTRADLQELIDFGQSLHPPIGVIVDLVLAHVRAPDEVEKRDWVKFRENTPKKGSVCHELEGTSITPYQYLLPIADYFLNREVDHQLLSEIIHPWSSGHCEGGWPSGALPALKGEHPTIIGKQQAYIDDLLKMGVSGFRLDVARQLPPSTLKKLRSLSDTKGKNFIVYGEIIENNETTLTDWRKKSGEMPVTAYHTFDLIKNALSFGSNIQSLHSLKDHIKEDDITFVSTHDTFTGGLNGYFKMADAKTASETTEDLILAQQFLIGGSPGTPLILWHLMDHPAIETAIRFKRQTGDSFIPVKVDWYDQYDGTFFQDYAAVIQKGESGFMAMNKHGTKNIDWRILLQNSSLRGCFQNLSDAKDRVLIDGDNLIKSTSKLLPRSASFFVRVEDSKCL